VGLSTGVANNASKGLVENSLRGYAIYGSVELPPAWVAFFQATGTGSRHRIDVSLMFTGRTKDNTSLRVALEAYIEA
jgi:hypothetical protein